MTLDLSLLPDGGVPWLAASGEHSAIVLSSRIRPAFRRGSVQSFQKMPDTSASSPRVRPSVS